jgi:hypothetical protein
MIDIASLVILCQTALSGGSRLIESHKKKLSDAERELLIAAHQQGTFFIHDLSEIPGSWVKAGDNSDEESLGQACILEAGRRIDIMVGSV